MAEKWMVTFPTSEGSINFYATVRTVLHVNPRPNEGQIVFNDQVAGKWGSEERIPLPRCGNNELVLLVVATNNAFDIFHDNIKIHSFSFRHNPSSHWVNSTSMTQEKHVWVRKLEE